MLTPRGDLALRVCVVLAALAGAVLRIWRGATLGLNPDEALQLLPCHAGTFKAVLEGILQFHHPPLYLILTAMLGPLLQYELGARMVAIAAGALLPVALFVWLRRWMGPVGAGAALVVTALSPNLITLSAQVRSYTLAWLLVVLAMLYLDRGINLGRASRIWVGGGMFVLAVLTDYSVAIVAPAVTLYGVWRLAEKRLPPRFWIPWMSGVGAALVSFGLLYWFQIRGLDESVAELGATYLRGGFRGDGQSLAVFAVSAVLKQFAYLGGSVVMGALFLLVFAGAVVWGARGAWRTLLLVPFATGLILALLQLMPFGRTRHSGIVSVIIAVGIALAADRWLSRRVAPVVMVLVVALMFGMAEGDVLDIPDPQLDRAAMRMAPGDVYRLTDSGKVPVLATEEALLVVEVYRTMQGRAAVQLEMGKDGPLLAEDYPRVETWFRKRHNLPAAEALLFLEGGFFPLRPPGNAELLGTWGIVRLWRVTPAAVE